MRRIPLGIGLLYITCLVACTASGPELAEVTGTVTLDGAPLAGANLMFTNKSQAIRGSVGKTDENGSYRLVFNMHRTGCVPGLNSVDISTQDTDAQGRNIPERVPKRYRGDATELSAQVAPGKNTFNFDLVTQGKEAKELSTEAAKAARSDAN
jgi:hypothetical protein